MQRFESKFDDRLPSRTRIPAPPGHGTLTSAFSEIEWQVEGRSDRCRAILVARGAGMLTMITDRAHTPPNGSRMTPYLGASSANRRLATIVRVEPISEAIDLVRAEFIDRRD